MMKVFCQKFLIYRMSGFLKTRFIRGTNRETNISDNSPPEKNNRAIGHLVLSLTWTRLNTFRAEKTIKVFVVLKNISLKSVYSIDVTVLKDCPTMENLISDRIVT